MNPGDRTELLKILARESYLERELTLTSGRSSAITSIANARFIFRAAPIWLGELMLELVTANRIEQIGGMAVGAIPLTDAIIAAAYRHGVNLGGFFVRKEIKPHGLQQKIEGAFRKDRVTAVLDDTITTGGSTLAALAALREAGARVTAAFALVDRNEGARDAFARAGLLYSWIFTSDEVRAAAQGG